MAGNSNLNYLVCQFGMPLYGVAGTPPFTGNFFWVNATTGSDGNTGGPQDPFATLTQALTACTANNNDVVFLTGTYHVTAAVNWSKNFTHLIGLTSPSDNCRARISATGATAFTPLVNVTGNGCMFKNIGTFHGGFTGATGPQVCWAENGGRNYYENVQFLGGGDATTAALAGMRSLTIGSDENLFRECTIGLDTIVRATNANASMELVAGVSAQPARNIMRSCVFQSLVSDASDTHITATVIDRYLLLDNCSFINAIDSSSTAMTAAIVNTPGTGSIIVQGGFSLGGPVAASGEVYVTGPVPTGATSSLPVKAT